MEKLKIINSQSINIQKTRIEGSMLFEEGSEAANILFSLRCQNLPVGTIVGFNCPGAGPNPPIDLPPMTVSTYPTFTAGIESFVPADFVGTIVYYAEYNDSPPPDAKITMQAAYVVNGG